MRTSKKVTAMVLVGALAVSSVAVVPAQAKVFNDVPSTHWAYKVVDEVSNKGIMIGTGSGIFSPNTQLTRAEYATVLANLATDKSNGRFEAAYTDVPANAWYASTVEWVVSNGLFTVKNGKFEPNKPISRELMADMTYKFIYYLYTDQIVPNTSSAGYADESEFSSEYTGSINALTHNGLLAGRDGNRFEPQGTLTRAEAAAMASRLLAVVEKGSDSEVPEEPSEPENPTEPSEPENPGETEDPNNPANWDLDGAPEWFLVGQPDNITDEQWAQLITYYKDHDCPAEAYYPKSINDIPATYRESEEKAAGYLGRFYISRLYNIMQQQLAEEALAADRSDVTITADEYSMIDMINTARKAAGVQDLIISPSLCKAADIRAEEALISEPHERPNGEPCEDVLSDEEIGLEYLKMDGATNSIYMAENQTVRLTNRPFPASDAFSNFMNSPAHKNNLLTATHKYVGVGYYSNGSKSAWIQIFGRIQ